VVVKFDYLSPTTTEGATGDGPISTAKLAIIDWHLLLMYPAGKPTDQIMIKPRVRPPAGWDAAAALKADASKKSEDSYLDFEPVSVTALVDAPLICGQYFREIELARGVSDGPSHYIDMVADSAAALEAGSETIGHYQRIVAEMAALFGSRHYREYRFLLTLSDHVTSFGLEHHECSDNRVAERMFLDDDELLKEGGLLTHEYFHSWNGKFRRPAGLCTPDFQKNMRTDLLWVYEGLTEYYGDLLAARCGTWTNEQYREYLASTAANLAHTAGRRWRPLQDTADSAPILSMTQGSWGNWRRSLDYYDEGDLIWLDADTLIREKSGGKKSLDDFCRVFHGSKLAGGGGLDGETPRVQPYSEDDVFAALNSVVASDWKSFFRERLTSTDPAAPMDGVTRSGWKLVYNDDPNPFVRGAGSTYMHSLGISLGDDGSVKNVVMGMPADEAGVAPGMKVIAVNARKYSESILADAVRASEKGTGVELLLENGEYYVIAKIEYGGGMKIPHLERDDSKDDVLGAILAPLSTR
jgi:predicted metalloprotease with PDZ domain